MDKIKQEYSGISRVYAGCVKLVNSKRRSQSNLRFYTSQIFLYKYNQTIPSTSFSQHEKEAGEEMEAQEPP